jgi:hypothetical protein
LDEEFPDEVPEMGLGGHPKLTSKAGRGWVKKTNAALDAWLRKRGLQNERTTPYTCFGKGTSSKPKPVELSNAKQVSSLDQRSCGERGNGKGNNAARPVRGTPEETQRKTKKRKKEK